MTTLTTPPPIPSAPPPVGPAPALTTTQRTALRVTIIALAAVVVTAVVAALAALAVTISNFRVVTDSEALPPTIRSLVIDTGAVPAAVRIVTDPRAREPRVDLRMVNSTRAGSDPLTLNTDRAEARIAIDDEPTPFLRFSRAGEITVTLPEQVAARLSVTTRQQTGMVKTEARLDELIARVDDGAVLLGGSARRVEIDNVNGEVRTDDSIAVSEEFSAHTVNADIQVTFDSAPPSAVDVSSRRGDVVVTVPGPGPFLVNADTGNTDGSTVVRVPRTSDRGEAVSVINARTDNGDVVIDGR